MTLDEQSIYEDHILRHYEEPYHNEPFVSATHRQRIDNGRNRSPSQGRPRWKTVSCGDRP